VHFLGEIVKPDDTAVYFSLADLLVIPGLVGLAIVHGFAYGLPMVTTQHDFHSPEIEYLSPQSGVISEHDPVRYSETILRLLENSADLRRLRQGAYEQGSRLYIRDSARRFLNGVTTMFQQADRSRRESFV
jgi:glycosyltransferase involved in cell wall biosynthesis